MDAVFAVDRIVAGRVHGGADRVHQVGQVIGVDQALEGVERVLDRDLGQAVDLAATLVPVAVAGLRVVVPAAQARGLDGDAQVGLGGLQRRLDAFALGDVDHHPAVAHRPALCVALDSAPGLDPFERAVGLDQAVLLEEVLGGLQMRAALGDQAGAVVGMQRLAEIGQRRSGGGVLGIDVVEGRVAGVGIDLVGDDVPVPGADAAGRFERQLIALLAGPQRLFGPHPPGGVGQRYQHPADPGDGGRIGQRAEADREVALGHRSVGVLGQQEQVLDDLAAAFAGHDRPLSPLGLDRRGRRGLGEGLAQGRGMAVAQHRRVGVVIDQHQFRSPTQGAGKLAGHDHVDGEVQARRPGRARTQRRRRPVERLYPPTHVVGRRFIDGAPRFTGVHHARGPSHRVQRSRCSRPHRQRGFKPCGGKLGLSSNEKRPFPPLGRKRPFLHSVAVG